MPHAGHEIHQTLLVRMGGVAANRVDAGANIETLAVQFDVTTLRAMLLDDSPRRALGLIANEQHVMAFVAKHGLQVVDDAAAAAHAVAGNHDGGAGRGGQVAHHAQVGVVAFYR
ncbi:hypothetical protein D9M70_618800 [compost metagenome]